MTNSVIPWAPTSVCHNREQGYVPPMPRKFLNRQCDQSSSAPTLSLEQRFEGLTIVSMPQHLMPASTLRKPSIRFTNDLATEMGDSDDGEKPFALKDAGTMPKSEWYTTSSTLATNALRHQKVHVCTKPIMSNDEGMEQKVRKKMIRLLEIRLKQKCQSPEDMSTEVDAERISNTARSLEQLLWKSAKDVNAYSDLSTLDDRLRGLMTIMVRRRMCQSAKRKRTQILQNILGRTRYGRARDLVRDIGMAKINKLRTLQCNGDVCGRTFAMNLPAAVRSLYFETTLVQAFEKYGLERLPPLDWDLLMEQAERNLMDFQRWEEEDAATESVHP